MPHLATQPRDEMTLRFLLQLQSSLKTCRLALRLPGENSEIFFSDQPWRLGELEPLIRHGSLEVRQGLPKEWNVLRIAPWNSSPQSGCLLCLQAADEPDHETVHALSQSVRLFWEREESRVCHNWRADMLQTLLNHSLELITLVTMDGRVYYQTPSFGRLLNLDPVGDGVHERAPSSNYLEWVHPDDLPLVRDCLLRIVTGEASVGPTQYRLLARASGRHQREVRCVESWFSSVESQAGVFFVVIHSRDITSRKVVAEALLRRERRHRQLLNQMNQAVFEFDPSGTLSFVNANWESVTGASSQSSVGRPLTDFFALPSFFELPLHREIACCSGSQRWVELWLHPRCDNLERGWGAARDITERKMLQRQLQQIGQLVDQATEMVFRLDREGRVTYLNPAVEWRTSRSNQSLLGTPFFDLFAVQEGSSEQALDEVSRGGVWSGRLQGCKLDGSALLVEAVISKSVHQGFGESELLATCLDITRVVVLEEQLLAAQRLESLGLLVGGVAHDFNNLIQVIMANCCMEQIARQEEGLAASANLSDILAASERARTMTQQLLNSASRGPSARVCLDLNRVMPETIQLLQRWFPRNIQCRWVSGVTEARVNFSPGQLQQVVLNLAINARDAMPNGGILRVALDGVDGGFRLSFSDSGVGISASEIERIFDPFYTSKGSAGTGLGLSVVQGILNDHGGRIEVHSTLREGTTFQIVLPQTAEL